MSTAQQTTNEDLLEVMQDLMQMTSEGFAQTNARLDEHGKILAEHGRQLTSLNADVKELKADVRQIKLDIAKLKVTVKELSDKHAAYISDISDILDRIVALEKQSRLSQSEIEELRRLLQIAADWIAHAAKVLKLPVTFPS
jgi:chromosome segregation ATPase